MDCPFCLIKEKFSNIYLEGVNIPKEKQFGAWIDYEEDEYDNILWYAILNGDSYVRGHTLVISGVHILKITGNATKNSLKSIILGLNRVSKKLKNKLNCEAIHAMTLCEGQEHLHFHLIPRYMNKENSKDNRDTPNHEYSNKERDFFVNNYWERDKMLFNRNTNKKEYKDREDYEKRVNNGKPPIHGMWYAGYHERNYKFINPNDLEKVEERIKELKDLTRLLRDPNLKRPRFFRE